MRVYISGKISGLDKEEYMSHFADAEKKLLEMGHEPINPAKYNDMLPTTLSWDQYMWIDLSLLSLCDVIYMLDNWESSKGAKVEREMALKRHMIVIYENEEMAEREEEHE